MATNTNTDLTEEDAADLQFPKDSLSLQKDCQVATYCSNCNNDLLNRYILCVVCEKSICCTCFASGAEFGSHKNDHAYSVLSNDCVLFENSNWTAQDELTLLNGLINVGNFSNIAKEMSKSYAEVKEHYEEFYLERKGSLSLPVVSNNCNEYIPPVVPYRFRLVDVADPIRCSSSSPMFHNYAGYNAARSDFEMDYDASAEDLISHLQVIDDTHPLRETLEKLQCSIIHIYNRRLRERQRRKRVIKEHGLIMHRKMLSWLHRFDNTLSQSVYERLIPFVQFYRGQGFEYLMEGLHRVGELKMQIARLCDFRKIGIKSLKGANLYIKLQKQREECQQSLKAYYMNPLFSGKFKNIMDTPSSTVHQKRKGVFTPLDIIGMPAYEKLLPEERDLCRNVRLVPLQYLELKDILITENNRLGNLKLLTARRLLKIDVNKTRRLYDFLIMEGYINKPND